MSQQASFKKSYSGGNNKGAGPGGNGGAGSSNKPAGSKPTHVLKTQNEKGEFITICFLFTNESQKTGETYFKGTAKDENNNPLEKFYVMPYTPKKKD